MLYVIYKEAIYKIDVFRSEREFSNAFNVSEYFADLYIATAAKKL